MREEQLKEKTKEEVMSGILKELVDSLATGDTKDGSVNPFKILKKEMEVTDKLHDLISSENLTDDEDIRNKRLEFAYNVYLKIEEVLDSLGV